MAAKRTWEVKVTDEQRQAVEGLLRRRDLVPRMRERLEMVKAVGLGQDLATIEAWSGRSAGTIRRWVGRFLSGGAAALADAPRSGRPARADAAYLRAWEVAVETAPPALGLPFDVWTSGRLSAYLAETTGVRLAPGWLRALLGRRRFACGRPKHTLKHLQDAGEVTACQVELAAAEKIVEQEPDRYEFHHQDETHLETNPSLGRVWHRIGEQPTVPAVGVNRRLTNFGSVELFGRGRVEVLCATQDSAAFELSLQALEARHQATGREIFLVLDNGSCQRSLASQAALARRAAWRHVIWLARYSPELNRKEREWRYLKRAVRSHLARS